MIIIRKKYYYPITMITCETVIKKVREKISNIEKTIISLEQRVEYQKGICFGFKNDVGSW